MALQDYKNAIVLALSMEHSRKLYNLFQAITSSRNLGLLDDEEMGLSSQTITGNAAVDEVIKTLPHTELVKLLHCVRDWNTTAKTSNIAQIVLHAILKLRAGADIQKAFSSTGLILPIVDSGTAENSRLGKKNDGLKEVIDALIPYSERHLMRIERLIQDSYILDFLIGEMDDGVIEEDDLMIIDG